MAVSKADVGKAAVKLDFAIPVGHEQDYVDLLQKTDDACRAIFAFEGKFMREPQLNHRLQT